MSEMVFIFNPRSPSTILRQADIAQIDTFPWSFKNTEKSKSDLETVNIKQGRMKISTPL